MSSAYVVYLMDLQERWKRTSLPRSKIDAMVALVDTLIQRLIECDHNLSKVVLSYPQDCANADAFMSVGTVLDAFIRYSPGGGMTMSHFGNCYECY